MSDWFIRLTDEATAWSIGTIEALDRWVNRSALRLLIALPILAVTMVVSFAVATILTMIVAVLEAKDLVQDALRRRPP